jgi:Fe-S-cluster-containing dehydrogenase component/DMSO reductase anchor subunit
VKNGASWSISGSQPGDGLTLIDDLLGEQGKLTAVERFARAHDDHTLPALEKHYRRLLPATAPAPGQQYAFEVDLDKCSGCKACVTACHSLNGLDEHETWRSVGLLVNDPLPRGSHQPSYQQHITTACHHCVDPGCLNGCPVLAYDKDPVTGIVRHLDDQCIGCQYCVLKCPYEVPQYSNSRGIVRKCDMCSSRLAVGEAPACVQACPHEAIKITLVEPARVRGKYRDLPSLNFKPSHGNSALNNFLPASPNPAITLPTTRYVSARPLPEKLFAGDDAIARPAESHLPLVFLLTFSQLAVGASVAAAFVKSPAWLLLAAVIAGGFALGVGTLHLGKPLKAWRSFLGWRKSWFSREVIVFGAYVPLAGMAAATNWINQLAPFAKLLIPAAAFTGLLGVLCSVMIYVDTRREFWSAGQSFPKFFGTVLLLGAATTLAFSGAAMLAALVIVAAAGKLAFEHRIFRRLLSEDASGQEPLNKSARLLAGELGFSTRTRVACGLIGGILLPALYLLTPTPTLAATALALCVAGELLERYLFFTAVVTRKMPGAIAA